MKSIERKDQCIAVEDERVVEVVAGEGGNEEGKTACKVQLVIYRVFSYIY
jgi:hypothetical protein